MKYITQFKVNMLLIALLVCPQLVSAQTATNPNLVFDNPIKTGNDIYAFVNAILNFVVKIGTVAVIFMVIYSGFLFVKAQGDDSAISEAKKTFFWTVIGGIVLIGARVLAGVVCNTAAGLGAAVRCGV